MVVLLLAAIAERAWRLATPAEAADKEVAGLPKRAAEQSVRRRAGPMMVRMPRSHR